MRHGTNNKTGHQSLKHCDNLSQPSVKSRDNEGSKPGPKPQPLEDLVRQLASHGSSSGAIAWKVSQQGISVSYKTVQRRLQGSFL